MTFRRDRSKTIGKVSELTIATPIKRGLVGGELRTYRKRLCDVLAGFQWRIDARIETPPGLIGTIHFARWFIIDDRAEGTLVFTSNFDGDLKAYLRDFSAMIPEGIDEIWQNCEGYPELGCRDFDRFWRYAIDHRVETRAFVPAHPDLTVRDIELLSAHR
jgi:hypothetical protein